MTTPTNTQAPFPPGPGRYTERGHPIDFLQEMRRRFGDFVRYETAFGPVTFVNEPEAVRNMLFDTDNFPRNQILSVLLGKGLLQAEGDPWRNQRRTYQPKFHPGALATYADIMVEEAEKTCDMWAPFAKSGEPIDLLTEMMDYSLRASSRIFLGGATNMPTRSLSEATSQVVTHLGRYGSTLPLTFTPEEAKRQRIALGLLNRIIDTYLERRRGLPEGPDLLWSLMTATDENGERRIPDDILRDEVSTMLLGGHETTGVALTWLFWECSRRPEVLESARAEWESLLPGRNATLEDVPGLEQGQKLINETLRLHPPVWAMVRNVLEDELVGPYQVLAGEQVIFSHAMLHRHPDVWESPDEFLPERWREGLQKKLPRGSFVPFGVGPHTCIGQHFAQLELHIALPLFHRRYRMTPLDSSEPGTLPTLTQRPARPLMMRLEEVA